MQVKKLSALCALACAALSGQAVAADLTLAQQAIVNDANTNNRVVFISGASAVQAGFTGIISSLINGPIRLANTTANSRDFEAVAGTLIAAAGGWTAGSNVIVIYRTKGGSVFGVDPVARNQAIESLNVTSTTCGDSRPGGGVGTGGAGTSTSPYVCTTSLNSRIPDVGVSDVAPRLFHGDYNTEGGEIGGPNGGNPAPALIASELAALGVPVPLYGLAFGVPITKNVGLVDLDKATISAIMTGNLGTWNQVNSTLAADDILICRRVPGSGTQAVFNMYFGNYPCNTTNAFNVPADRNASAAWDDATNTYTVSPGTGGVVVIENSTSGDVRKCLNSAVTGLPYTTSDRDGNLVNVSFTSPNNKAVGVLSMDSLSNSNVAGNGPDGIPNNADDTGNWQFRSLDGAGTITWNTAFTGNPVVSGTGKFPTLAEYETGDWDEQGWISWNVPTRTTGNKLAFANNFRLAAQNPAILASINTLKFVAAAIPGGIYTGPQVLDATYLNRNQCAPYNRNFND